MGSVVTEFLALGVDDHCFLAVLMEESGMLAQRPVLCAFTVGNGKIGDMRVYPFGHGGHDGGIRRVAQFKLAEAHLRGEHHHAEVLVFLHLLCFHLVGKGGIDQPVLIVKEDGQAVDPRVLCNDYTDVAGAHIFPAHGVGRGDPTVALFVLGFQVDLAVRVVHRDQSGHIAGQFRVGAEHKTCADGIPVALAEFDKAGHRPFVTQLGDSVPCQLFSLAVDDDG